jgi:UDP-N-acetyl-D-galactosamine dehydrogenase
MHKIAVIGLGYVGLNLATRLSAHFTVIGYDSSQNRIQELKSYYDINNLYSEKQLKAYTLTFSHQLNDIKDANFYIVAVPTPVLVSKSPDLRPLISATKTLAMVLKKGDIVVYESTVYPGATEEVCLPILEEISKLKCGLDYDIGYSPERINPSDEVHVLSNITKIISAQNKSTLKKISTVYASICNNVHSVSNIATAEAVKLLENTQRDINIALINEFTKIMHALNLDTREIIEAAKTKWNFIPFNPGFVGGHCIAVDPYYLAYKAQKVGIKPELLLTARKINDGMPQFVVEELIKLFQQQSISLKKAKVGILGYTYKGNVKDERNSLTLNLIKLLQKYDVEVKLHDPLLNPESFYKKYHYTLLSFAKLQNLTAVILVVGHDFYQQMGVNNILKKLLPPKIFIDLPNLFVRDKETMLRENVIYWNL